MFEFVATSGQLLAKMFSKQSAREDYDGREGTCMYMMAEKDHACRRLKSSDGRMRCAMVGCDARCYARW